MWRVIVGPILGYALMVIVVMCGIAITWFSTGGPGFAFDGDSVNASLAWTLSMLGCGLIAAIAGGFVASSVGGLEYRHKSVAVLAGLICLLGLVTIIMQSMAEPLVLPEGKKVSELTFVEARQYARSPMWYNFAIVVVGVVGTFIGGSLKGRKVSPEEVTYKPNV